MRPTRPTQRIAVSLTIGLGLLVLFFFLTHTVADAGLTAGPAPGYPKEGCYGVVTAGTGMWDGTGQITVNVPGPIVDAYLVWAGAFENGGAELTVNGQVVVGERLAGVNLPPEWVLWRVDLGRENPNLVVTGINVLNISGWEGTGPLPYEGRNGATLVVIYEKTRGSACLKPVDIQVYEYLDWIYRSFSELQVHTIVPAPFTRTVTATISFAGTDSEPRACRESRLLFRSGLGAHPTSPLSGSDVIASNPLRQQSAHGITCTVALTSPLTSLSGGYVGAQWSVFTAEIAVPPNHDWVAFQLYSVNACHGGACGESGAWVSTVLTTTLPTPQLVITKTDNETNVVPGQTLTYTITYHNAGDRTARDVRIVDELPGRSVFVGCPPYNPVPQCTYSNGHVVFKPGDVEPGAGGVVTAVVKLDDLFPAGRTWITNRATISTITPGDNLANNRAVDVDIVTAAVDLKVAKSGPPVAAPEDRVTYLITATATGNAWADNARITDVLPEHTEFAGCDPNCDRSGDAVTWPIGRITPGDIYSVTLSVTVNSPLTNGLVITNTASIAANSTNPATSPPVTTTVRSDHSLVIEKSAVQNPVFAGQRLTYTIDWGVTGNEPAREVVITDVIPEGTMFAGASDDCQYDQASNTVLCRLHNQSPPVSGAVALTVNVNEPPISLIDNTAVICDDDPETPCVSDSPDDPYLLSHIGGLVWLDENGDGLPIGETGIPSVAMTLTVAGPGPACPGPPPDLATTHTSASGLYGFLPLQWAPFTYCVDIAEPPILCPVRTTPPPNPIHLPPGASSLNNDFGYQSNPASIGGVVFQDMDQDTARDEDEPGLREVTICLRDSGADDQCGTSDDGSPECMVTPVSGEYSFGKLTPGKYCVSAPPLQGRRLTTPEARIVPVYVHDCGVHVDLDFGYSGVYTVSLELADTAPSVGARASAQITVTYPISASQFISGQRVHLRVEGVHSLAEDLITDANGRADYAYYYNAPFNRAGQDTVTAWLDWDADQALDSPPEPSDDAPVDWRPVSLAVDYHYQCLAPANCSVLRTFTAAISNRQIPPLGVPGIRTAFMVAGGTSFGPTAMETGSDGKAVFSYTSTAPPGTVTRATRLPDDLPSCSGGQPVRIPDARDLVVLWVDLDRDLVFDRVPDGEPGCAYDLVTAITLASFTAEPAGMGSVRLNWETAVEIDSAGFNLYRATTTNGPYTRINPLLIAATGAGGGASYSYIDAPPGSGVYYYELEEVDVYGESTFHGPVSVAFLTSWPRIFLPTIQR